MIDSRELAQKPGQKVDHLTSVKVQCREDTGHLQNWPGGGLRILMCNSAVTESERLEPLSGTDISDM